MQFKRLFILAIFSSTPLLIPLIAMQFTNEVNWNFMDFTVGWVLLFSTSLICWFTLRNVKKAKQRIAICVVILLSFLLVWAELAVGIFGTPLSGN